MLVGLSDLTIETNRIPTGIILALVSAFFYAAYIVFIKRKVDHEDKMDIPMFFGFVGLFNLTLLWPLFFILHYGHWEEFEWPDTHQWTFLIINGLIGTVLSEVLWLWYVHNISFIHLLNFSYLTYLSYYFVLIGAVF